MESFPCLTLGVPHPHASFKGVQTSPLSQEVAGTQGWKDRDTSHTTLTDRTRQCSHRRRTPTWMPDTLRRTVQTHAMSGTRTDPLPPEGQGRVPRRTERGKRPPPWTSAETDPTAHHAWQSRPGPDAEAGACDVHLITSETLTVHPERALPSPGPQHTDKALQSPGEHLSTFFKYIFIPIALWPLSEIGPWGVSPLGTADVMPCVRLRLGGGDGIGARGGAGQTVPTGTFRTDVQEAGVTEPHSRHSTGTEPTTARAPSRERGAWAVLRHSPTWPHGQATLSSGH